MFFLIHLKEDILIYIKKSIRNAIDEDEEPEHKEPKEIRYESEVLGKVYITASELQSLVVLRKNIVHNFV
jgi:hypothetical protein